MKGIIASWNCFLLLAFDIKQNRDFFFYRKNAMFYITSLLGNRSSIFTFLLSPIKESFLKKIIGSCSSPCSHQLNLRVFPKLRVWGGIVTYPPHASPPAKGLNNLLFIFCVIYTVTSGLKKKYLLCVLSLWYCLFSWQNSVAGALWNNYIGTPKELWNYLWYFLRHECCHFKPLKHKIYKSPGTVPSRKDDNHPFGAIPNALGMHVY